MKFLLLSLLGFLAVEAGEEEMKQIMNEINFYNLRSHCWGEENVMAYDIAVLKATDKCMQLAPAYDLVELLRPINNPFTTLPGAVNNPFQKLTSFQNLNQLTSLWRSKRAASSGLLNADQNDFIEFLEDFGEFKEGIATKMGNLTCVLTEMKLLTPDLKINIEEYTKPVAEIEGFKPEISVAGQDPAFAKKLSEGFMDCYRISENWPQAPLNRNPLSKIFGRHMIFFKCADKTERKMCAKAQMLQWLETIYGTDPEYDPKEHGLPEDKYDAAAVSIMVLNNAATPEEQFVGDFFWGMGH
jgi:hypothetical protein